LGSSSGEGTPPLGGINFLYFNNGKLSIDREYIPSQFFATNASISNQDGNLLFYSNGCKIFNKEREVMENGSGLNPGSAYSTGNCPDEGNAVPKGLMILPLPGDSTQYYVFHISAESGNPGTVFSIYGAKLYYSLVDMSANNGLGTVIEKNEVVIADTLHADMHAVRHANGEDWWLLFGKANKPLIFSVLFTQDGIAGVFEQGVGPQPDPWFSSGGMTCFSPDGTKYARYYKNEQVSLFDFDRETGLLGNFQQFHADTTGGNSGGVAFSASGRYLYVNSRLNLVQFDLQASDIQASRTVVGEYDGYLWFDFFPTTFGLMQLAPDCKIYMSSRSGSDILHVIHSPDEPGLACNFVQHEFHLPAVNTYTIPNFPNYRLGTGFPVCDPTIQLVTSSVRVLPPQREVAVFPNPASGQVLVEVPQPLATEGQWSLYNAVGQRVVLQPMARGVTRVEVPLTGLPAGLYFWEMRDKERKIDSGKLIVSE
jgi:hypothetical protein